MQKNKRYPQINIRSKNELSKRISSKNFPQEKALELINDVIENFDKYWHDSKKSEPDKEKFVRSSAGTPLHILSKLIKTKILEVHDHLVPEFIFGGISERSHIDAAYELIGKKNKRTLLKMDITRFFEQVTGTRVFHFFNKKCGCSVRASRLLASLCCVPTGKKGNGSSTETIARGFSTSSRLAVWANLDTFLKLKWEVQKQFKGHDPKIAIFVDDIGITASEIDTKTMESLKENFEYILTQYDHNQPLPINLKKTKVRSFEAGAEHLGLRLGRNNVTIGSKTKSKRAKLRESIKVATGFKKKQLKMRSVAYNRYENQIKNVNKNG